MFRQIGAVASWFFCYLSFYTWIRATMTRDYWRKSDQLMRVDAGLAEDKCTAVIHQLSSRMVNDKNALSTMTNGASTALPCIETSCVSLGFFEIRSPVYSNGDRFYQCKTNVGRARCVQVCADHPTSIEPCADTLTGMGGRASQNQFVGKCVVVENCSSLRSQQSDQSDFRRYRKCSIISADISITLWAMSYGKSFIRSRSIL